MAVVGLAAQDVAGDVTVVQPLHDDHDGRLFVVEAVRHRFSDETDRLLTLSVAFGLDDVVGVVEENTVAALAGGEAADLKLRS